MNDKNKMSIASSQIQILLFCAFIGAFFLLFIIIPDKKNSEQENRELQTLPEFSFESLFSKQFTSKFESYTTDQFPFRDSWTTLKARCEFLSGKQENKNVYLCENNSLIERYDTPDQTQLDTNIDAVASLSEKTDVPVYFCLIPGAAEIYSDTIPKNAPNDSQLEVIEYCYGRSGNANNIDIYSTENAHRNEYIYYRTDHHWTSLGAYYGSQAILRAMGMEQEPLTSFQRKTVSDSFYGTVYSKSGITWVEPDSIETFADQSEGVQVFNYASGEAVETGLYDEYYLSHKDKYSFFMGGISPMRRLTSSNTEAPSLLIIRDSYTDSLIPFLQDKFSEIHLMDLRYYKTQLFNSSVAQYIEENNIDQVLVCYSVYNFGTDTNVFLMGLCGGALFGKKRRRRDRKAAPRLVSGSGLKN